MDLSLNHILDIGLRRGQQRRVPVRLRPRRGSVRGSALLSYLAEPAAWSAGDRRLRGHTNKWESREFAHALCDLGWVTDVIDFNQAGWEPKQDYDVVIALDAELITLREAANPSLALIHMTGAAPAFQNTAEIGRIDELARRRSGVVCTPRRLVPDTATAQHAQETADACSLVGNDWTLSTYPGKVQQKTTLLDVTASSVRSVKVLGRMVPSPPEFLWFFGSGAVHKGLDRVLEVFAVEPDLTLHVAGNISGEQDFLDAYQHELYELPNIQFHGIVDPMSRDFSALIDRCVGFVAPSCSEGMSPSCATLLQVGLYPIISRETGISLPTGTGLYLEQSSSGEIREAVLRVAGAPRAELERELEEIQRDALNRYSRASFATNIRAYLTKILA